MSSIYVLEPPTSGKVLLKTTVGDIDVELWAKETPLACKNFIQLCLEGYYNNTIFHRVVKGFIAQGGDPNGDGTGGESIYGAPFKDEFHQRLRFSHRGIVAMANSEKDDNGSQFFFTFAEASELQNKHTIFGKVAGNTIFNMLKLEEGLLEGERPVYPHKILKTEVLNNPFSDIVPRVSEETKEKKKKKEKKKGVKDFKLLSFGAEAEEDEEETNRENQKFSGKSKSTHDVLDDPKLIGEVDDVKLPPVQQIDDKGSEDEDEEEVNLEEQLQNIRKKLKVDKDRYKVSLKHDYDDEEQIERKRKREEIKKEIESVKRDYHKNKLKREQEKTEEDKNQSEKTETIKEYQEEIDKYKDKKQSLPKKGADREKFTLQLLSKFKQKLSSVKDKDDEEASGSVEKAQPDEELSWMSHQLHFKDDAPVLAKDANTKDDDWFEIYDPRNPINKRRRGENPNKLPKK